MDRAILHCDLNSFYASVECLYNPKIRDYPVAVCGDPDARHGIILAKNQIAKGYGVTTGEAIWQAKSKCPGLITVKANFSLYLKVSKLVKKLYEEYTDMTESFGIDESWLDVTGSVSIFGNGESIANEIRQRIFREYGITASVGVSFNKVFAKLGSDLRKPDATTVIRKEDFKNTIWRLPASELLYVGYSTAQKLKRVNIKTIGELATCNVNIVHNLLGKWGVIIHRFANGLDNSPVEKNNDEAFMKSIGNSITAPRDLVTVADIKSVLYMLSESVAARLREHGVKCTTVQIYVRDKDLSSCERQAKLDCPTFITSEIAEKALEIFVQKYKFTTPIRTIGVRGTDFVNKNTNEQLSFFIDTKRRDKLEAIEHTVDEIRRRFGYKAIQKGLLLVDKNLTGIDIKSDNVIHPSGYF